MHRIRRAILIGFITGALGIAVMMVPACSTIEDTLGLRWMFWVRGPLEPPPGVAVVSIDETSATRLGLPAALRDWPRSVHAQLIDRLVELGASAIAFDVEFFRHGVRAEDDQKLADAAARAQRVVFVQRFEVLRIEGREVWRRLDPIPELARAAASLAPVPLPDAPFVSWVWVFFDAPQSGDLPTLPAVMLQLHALSALPHLRALLERSGAGEIDRLTPESAVPNTKDLPQMMQAIRRHVASQSQMLTALARNEPKERDNLLALIAAYGGRQIAYLNYFGPPGTICTIPYHLLLSESPVERPPCSLHGRAVFIGGGSSPVARADQADTYHTVYGQADGADLSGVEIHATAFANLLARRTLQPVESIVAWTILMASGGFVAGIAYLVRTRARQASSAARGRMYAAATALGLSAVYGLLAQLLFSLFDVVVPLVTHLLVQLPAALVLALVVAPVRVKTLVSAVCLSTDAAGYTSMADRLDPRHLADLMGEYFENIGTLVRHRGGQVLPPGGDSLMCLWREPSSHAAIRLQACLAALEVADAIDRFNDRHRGETLPTRIGLHEGPVVVQSDVDRGMADLVGDAPNVAQRLQELNRTLRSRVLGSEAVVKDVGDTLLLRRLGVFELRGKERGVTVFEIMGRHDQISTAQGALRERFSQALDAYEIEDWGRSADLFEALLADYPLDGPTEFYVKKLRNR